MKHHHEAFVEVQNVVNVDWYVFIQIFMIMNVVRCSVFKVSNMLTSKFKYIFATKDIFYYLKVKDIFNADR